MAKLENWAIVQNSSNNPFQAPELITIRLQGNVYDREGFKNGTLVRTSSVQEIDLENNIAQTRNTTYNLGEPSKEYIEWLDNNGKSLEDYIHHKRK